MLEVGIPIIWEAKGVEKKRQLSTYKLSYKKKGNHLVFGMGGQNPSSSTFDATGPGVRLECFGLGKL